MAGTGARARKRACLLRGGERWWLDEIGAKRCARSRGVFWWWFQSLTSSIDGVVFNMVELKKEDELAQKNLNFGGVIDDYRIVKGGGWMKLVPKDARDHGECVGGGLRV
jgi:hypothetical protein